MTKVYLKKTVLDIDSPASPTKIGGEKKNVSSTPRFV